jgi:CDP-paratose 2-epimerase
MPAVLITGSAGLIGAEAVQFYCRRGYLVIGVDNDMRRHFFGEDASTRWKRDALLKEYPQYTHYDVDVRDREAIERIFREYGADIGLVVHAAAQPSHDWAARDPHMDFTVNANGTLTLLEATRQFCP